jgi:hypothetical protein
MLHHPVEAEERRNFGSIEPVYSNDPLSRHWPPVSKKSKAWEFSPEGAAELWVFDYVQTFEEPLS